MPDAVTNPSGNDIVSQNVTNDQLNTVQTTGSGSVSTDTDSQLNQQQFFQSEFDKISSLVDKYGIKLKPGVNYQELLEPIFRSHQAMTLLDKEPERLLEIARERFPDEWKRPTFEDKIIASLQKEFGEDFEFNQADAYIRGTPSYNYRVREAEIRHDIMTTDTREKIKADFEAKERQRLMADNMNQGIQTASKQLGIPVAKVEEYMAKLSNPETAAKYNSIASVVVAMLYADGNLEVDLSEFNNTNQPNPGNTVNLPPSVTNLQGNQSQQKGFLDDVFTATQF